MRRSKPVILVLAVLAIAGCGGSRSWQVEPTAACLRRSPSLAGALVRVPKLTPAFRDIAFGKGRLSQTRLVTVSTTNSRQALWLVEFFTPSAALAKSAKNSLDRTPRGVPQSFHRLTTSRNVVIGWRFPATDAVERDVADCLHS